MNIQRFLDLPEGSGLTIFSVKPGNSLNPKLLMININLGLEKYSVKNDSCKSENLCSRHRLISPLWAKFRLIKRLDLLTGGFLCRATVFNKMSEKIGRIKRMHLLSGDLLSGVHCIANYH